MRLGLHISGTLLLSTTCNSAAIPAAPPSHIVARAKETAAPAASLLPIRAEHPQTSSHLELKKRAVVQCPESVGLPPMPCAMHICGGESALRSGYCNDQYPSARDCRCSRPVAKPRAPPIREVRY